MYIQRKRILHANIQANRFFSSTRTCTYLHVQIDKESERELYGVGFEQGGEVRWGQRRQ